METNENKHLNTSHTTVEPYKNINYGWKCPVCGRILAPWVPECPCNGFSNPRDITCQVKNLKASESILEGQMNHIPQIDSNFNDFEPQNEEKLLSHILGGETLDTIAIFPPKTINDDPMYVQRILNEMKNPLAGCKQVGSGGYILDGPPKNNIVPIDILKRKEKK